MRCTALPMRSSSLRDLASMANAMEGSGSLHRRIGRIGALVGQRIAGEGVLQLGDRADIAGVQLGDGLKVFAEGRADVRQPLAARAAVTFCRLASFFTTPV